MKELPLNPRQSELLKEFDQAGGVVEYVLVDASRLSASPYELHRAVAIFGLQVVDARLIEWAKKHECDGHPASMFSRVTVIPPGPVGRQITVQEFENGDGQSGFATPGYRGAFQFPPYSLSPENKEAEQLYAEVNRAFFGDLNRVTELFTWSTEWSNYFDLGHEWWGAFLWTARPAPDGPIIWVAASSTD
jgi:hypothetical protein